MAFVGIVDVSIAQNSNQLRLFYTNFFRNDLAFVRNRTALRLDFDASQYYGYGQLVNQSSKHVAGTNIIKIKSEQKKSPHLDPSGGKTSIPNTNKSGTVHDAGLKWGKNKKLQIKFQKRTLAKFTTA